MLGVSDVGSHARTRRDEALGGEGLDRLAKNGPADTQFAPKVVFVRKDISRAKRAGQDAEAEFPDNLSVEIEAASTILWQVKA